MLISCKSPVMCVGVISDNVPHAKPDLKNRDTSTQHVTEGVDLCMHSGSGPRLTPLTSPWPSYTPAFISTALCMFTIIFRKRRSTQLPFYVLSPPSPSNIKLHSLVMVTGASSFTNADPRAFHSAHRPCLSFPSPP